MYRTTCISLILLAVYAHGSILRLKHIPQLDGRIIGGEDTTIEQHPHQVSVRVFGSHTCGGSIYKPRVIITAAHCIIQGIGANYYSVEYGTTDQGKNENVIGVERLLRHPQYNPAFIRNDVALIFLLADIPFGPNAQPIQLPTAAPFAGLAAVVTGWGTTLEGANTLPTTLQQVGVNVVGSPECQEQYEGFNEITDDMLCAAVHGGGKDACQGDSGGPLVANDELIGIVSWGIGCARPNFAGVYCNVAYLKDWIEGNAF